MYVYIYVLVAHYRMVCSVVVTIHINNDVCQGRSHSRKKHIFIICHWPCATTFIETESNEAITGSRLDPKYLMQLISLSQKGTLSYIMKIKSRFALNRCVLLDPKISDFGWERGVFLVQNPRRGGVFLAWCTFWEEVWRQEFRFWLVAYTD